MTFNFGTSNLTFGAASTASPFSFSTPAPNTNTPFSFGAASTASAQPAATSLFNTAPQPFSFGSQTNTQQPLFGGSSLFASPTPLSNVQTQPSLRDSIVGGQKAPDQPIEERLQRIQASWNPQNPACVFKSYVYNVMDDARRDYYQKYGHVRNPQVDVDEALWLKATRENPDPSRYYPYLILGHDNLKKRVAQQDEWADKHRQKLEEIAAKLKQLSNQYSLQTSVRLQKATHQQQVISSRLMSLTARIHSLNPLAATPLSAQEEELKAAIDQLAATFTGKRTASDARYALLDSAGLASANGAGGHSKMVNKVNELWVAVAQKKARRQHFGAETEQEFAVTSEEELQRVLEVLTQQQRTLDHLSDTLTQDTKILDVIKAGFDAPSVAASVAASQARDRNRQLSMGHSR